MSFKCVVHLLVLRMRLDKFTPELLFCFRAPQRPKTCLLGHCRAYYPSSFLAGVLKQRVVTQSTTFGGPEQLSIRVSLNPETLKVKGDISSAAVQCTSHGSRKGTILSLQSPELKP